MGYSKPDIPPKGTEPTDVSTHDQTKRVQGYSLKSCFTCKSWLCPKSANEGLVRLSYTHMTQSAQPQARGRQGLREALLDEKRLRMMGDG